MRTATQPGDLTDEQLGLVQRAQTAADEVEAAEGTLAVRRAELDVAVQRAMDAGVTARLLGGALSMSTTAVYEAKGRALTCRQPQRT